METITTRGRSLEIPTHLAELTGSQYEYYCFLAFALSRKVITADCFRIRWLSYLVGLGKADYTILMPEHAEELDRQLHVIDGFLTGPEEDREADLETVVNLLPQYCGYRGPGDFFAGVTFGEFVECYTVAESLAGAGADDLEEGCRHIARTLYHIPESDTVPELLLFHAPRLFSNVWNAIQAAPVEINGKKIDFRIIFRSSGPARADDHTGWTGITFEIAAAGLFGNVENVKSVDMWTVLLYLYKCKFEYLEEKRRNHTEK